MLLDALARTGRSSLTAMYDDMLSGLKGGVGDGALGGGEILAAIRAAEALAAEAGKEDEDSTIDTTKTTMTTKKSPSRRCKIVLVDRDSTQTLRRAIDSALRSGDPMSVLTRIGEANASEMGVMEALVRSRMGPHATDAEITTELIESIKADGDFRNRLFERLERDVPEFTRAFFTERDYVMAEAIWRERDAERIVVVMGLPHFSGVAENLKKKKEKTK